MNASSLRSSLRGSLASPLLALLVSVVSPRAALAADIGNDEVTLKNGGSLRGTIVSSEPGASVKLLELGSDMPRVIPWADVAGVARDKFATAPGASSAPRQAPPPPPGLPPAVAPGAPGVVRLHVASPVPVDVYSHVDSYGSVGRHDVDIDTPTQVCSSPCDVVVNGTHLKQFSVVGDSANESSRFVFGPMTGDVTLDVDPGSPSLRGGAFALVTVGSAATGLGVIGAIAGAVGTSPAPDGRGFIKNDGLETAGIITASAGVAALITGIVLRVASATKLDLHPSASPSKTGATKPRYWAGEF